MKLKNISVLIIIFFLLLINNEKFIENKIKNFFDIKRISIIIPIFNDENYIKYCLSTAICQTLKNIEIICIDDGSTDNSSKIVKNFSKLNNNIKVLKQKNRGAAFSRNRAIKISKGKFISFIDSDDLYYDDKALNNLYAAAQKFKAIICGGGVRRFKKNIILNDIFFENEGFIQFIDYQDDFYYQRFIYNKNFLKKNKIYFPPYLRFQDPPFLIRAMTIAKKFYAIKNIVYKYRCNIKFKNLNLKQTIDLFNGFRDCLKIEGKMHLYKLYNLSLNRLNNKDFIERVSKYSQNIEFKKIIKEIINTIKLTSNKNYNISLNYFYQNISI